MIRIAYFSGTGGTAKAAKAVAEAFTARGIITDIQEIRRGKDIPSSDEEMLVLLFAVHAASAPLPVYEWLGGLTPAHNIPAVVISVSGGGEVFPNLGCRVSSIKRLERKGYRVVYEQTIVMPSNFLEATPDGYASQLLRVLPKKADAIADDVLAGMERRVKPRTIDRIISAMLEIEKKGAPWFGKALHVTDACTGCGWCARECPGANIRMKDGKPEFLKQCVLCTRCIYGCPVKAIQPKMFKSAVLKGGFDIHRIEASSAPFEEKKGVLWEGLRRYFEDEGM